MTAAGKGAGSEKRSPGSTAGLLLQGELRAILTEFALEVLGRGVPSQEHLEQLLDRYSLAVDQGLSPTVASLAQWSGGSPSA